MSIYDLVAWYNLSLVFKSVNRFEDALLTGLNALELRMYHRDTIKLVSTIYFALKKYEVANLLNQIHDSLDKSPQEIVRYSISNNSIQLS